MVSYRAAEHRDSLFIDEFLGARIAASLAELQRPHHLCAETPSRPLENRRTPKKYPLLIADYRWRDSIPRTKFTHRCDAQAASCQNSPL